VVRYWPLTNSFFLLGVLTSVPILVKIDQEMRPRECSQTDRYTDTLTADANRFYNLSQAICYSYGTDNKIHCEEHNWPVFDIDKLLTAPSDVKRYLWERDNGKSSLLHCTRYSPVADWRLHWRHSVDRTRIVIVLVIVGVPAASCTDSSNPQRN